MLYISTKLIGFEDHFEEAVAVDINSLEHIVSDQKESIACRYISGVGSIAPDSESAITELIANHDRWLTEVRQATDDEIARFGIEVTDGDGALPKMPDDSNEAFENIGGFENL